MTRISGLIVGSHQNGRCVTMRNQVRWWDKAGEVLYRPQSLDIIEVGAPGQNRTGTPVLTKPRILSGKLKKAKWPIGLGFREISPSKWSHSGLTLKRATREYAQVRP